MPSHLIPRGGPGFDPRGFFFSVGGGVLFFFFTDNGVLFFKVNSMYIFTCHILLLVQYFGVLSW